MPEKCEGWEEKWTVRFALLVEEGRCTKALLRQLPWKHRHLQWCLCKQDQPVSATPYQQDVIQAERKMLAQVLVWTFTYFKIKSKIQNNASLWGMPEVATEIFFMLEESSSSVISELGVSQKACDALLSPGFPSHLLWNCEVLLTALGETLEDKPEGVKGAWNESWIDWCCLNSTALLQGIKPGGGHGGWV